MRGVAYFVDIIGAQALLEVHQAVSKRVRLAKEERHQRVHSRRGKQGARVVFRQQRRGRNTPVVFFFEEA